MKSFLAAILLGLSITTSVAAPIVTNGVTTIEDMKYPDHPLWAKKAFEGSGGGS